MADFYFFQAICELFKRSLQTLMDDFAPLSKDIAELLVQMYQTIPHISILDLTKQVCLLYFTLFGPVDLSIIMSWMSPFLVLGVCVECFCLKNSKNWDTSKLP